MNESRKATRRDVRHGAWIFVGSGTPLIPCMLLDVSESGARLKIDPSAEVPADFILVLSRDKRLNRRCRMMWRDGGVIGARFLGRQSVTPKMGHSHGADAEAPKVEPAQNAAKAAAKEAPARAPEPVSGER